MIYKLTSIAKNVHTKSTKLPSEHNTVTHTVNVAHYISSPLMFGNWSALFTDKAMSDHCKIDAVLSKCMLYCLKLQFLSTRSK